MEIFEENSMRRTTFRIASNPEESRFIRASFAFHRGSRISARAKNRWIFRRIGK
jgi:hypothetical protein